MKPDIVDLLEFESNIPVETVTARDASFKGVIHSIKKFCHAVKHDNVYHHYSAEMRLVNDLENALLIYDLCLSSERLKQKGTAE